MGECRQNANLADGQVHGFADRPDRPMAAEKLCLDTRAAPGPRGRLQQLAASSQNES